MSLLQSNSGPIPGENFTSDTKNYPWHQPPEFTDIDKALDMMAKKLTEFQRANSIMTMIELGAPITRVTDLIVTAGISEGKWTPDFALLLAGPIARMIELICIGFEVEYKLGIEEDEDDFVTSAFFHEEKKLKEGSAGFKILEGGLDGVKEAAAEQSDEGAPPEKGIQQSGFMAMQGSPKEEASEEAV